MATARATAKFVSNQATTFGLRFCLTMTKEFCHSFTTFAAGCCWKWINACDCPASVRDAEKSGTAKSESLGGTVVKNPHLHPVLATKCHNCIRRALCNASTSQSGKGWYPRSDSNRQALRRGILNPLRLPFHHSGNLTARFSRAALPRQPGSATNFDLKLFGTEGVAAAQLARLQPGDEPLRPLRRGAMRKRMRHRPLPGIAL